MSNTTIEPKSCQHCAAEFSRKPHQTPGIWRRVKYCSRTCRRAARPQLASAKQPRTGHCVRCDEPTSTLRRYCSTACQYWSLTERLSLQVDLSGGPDRCWMWTGPVTPGGYGILGRTSGSPGVSVLAHRAAIERHLKARIPAGMIAMHDCDTPGCCNPAHIRIGTYTRNMQDAVARGRRARHCRVRKLSVEAVAVIRDEYRAGGVTLDMLADVWQVGRGTIHRIVRGQTYRDTEVGLGALLWPDGDGGWLRTVA